MPRTRTSKKRTRSTAHDAGPPPATEVQTQVAKAYAGLDAGRTLEDVLGDMGILVALGLLHPRTPEYVANALREAGRDTSGQGRQETSASEESPAALLNVGDRELLGLGPNARPDEIEAAHRKAILACHPDRFASISPAIQRVMDEVTARINGARAQLLNAHVERAAAE